jgi:RHS repeat-associated protein
LLSDFRNPLDRLSTVTWPDGSTLSITYDPLGLRNEEILKNSAGTVIADNKLLWLSGKIVADGTNNYWSFGQTTGNTQYYFGTDHLGSLRDVTDVNGNLVTEYDYDLWGNSTRIQGTQDFNLSFTGHWVIKDLVLAPFRAYNPYLGRWISRDPLEEKGGINLYAYVGNNPVSNIDPLGETGIGVFGGGSAEAGVVYGAGATGALGGGLFWGKSPNVGAFASGGAFVGGPGWTKQTAECGGQVPFVLGAYGGVGAGLFLTNADTARQLRGPFQQWNLNIGVGFVKASASFEWSNGTWVLSISVGPGGIASVSGYPTSTAVTK